MYAAPPAQRHFNKETRRYAKDCSLALGPARVLVRGLRNSCSTHPKAPPFRFFNEEQRCRLPHVYSSARNRAGRSTARRTGTRVGLKQTWESGMARNKAQIDWEQAALRRAKFLLEEARSGTEVYDAAVRYALRVISNWATVAEDLSSEAIKFRNRRISRKALDLYLASETDADWHKQTTNEHPEPIRQVWDWIVKEAQTLQPREILKRFQEWPMVTVTCDEDREINAAGHRWKGDPQVRHKRIDLVTLEEPLSRRAKAPRKLSEA